MDVLTSSGILVYDPHRPGLKKKKEWWCVLETDPGISDYYRWWVEKELQIQGLCKPTWGSHISVIRGEKPPEGLLHLWKKYDGEKIEFSYRPHPRVSGDTTGDRPSSFWFLDVECSRLMEIRKEFGFPTQFKLHLTVGRVWT